MTVVYAGNTSSRIATMRARKAAKLGMTIEQFYAYCEAEQRRLDDLYAAQERHRRVIVEDVDAITAARSRFNARKTDSALIAWICSDAWTDGDRYAHERGMARGRVIASTWCGDEASSVSGEIGGAA